MKRFIILLVMGLLFLTSCRTTYSVGYRADIHRFIGHSYEDIVNTLGSPSYEYDEADGYVLVYEGSESIFSYTYGYKRNYGIPTAKFLMGHDDICHDVTLYNTEPVYVPDSGGLITLLVFLFMIL